jgi:hypothetical protein
MSFWMFLWDSVGAGHAFQGCHPVQIRQKEITDRPDVVGGFEWPPLLRDGTRNPQAATETLERELKLLLNENL